MSTEYSQALSVPGWRMVPSTVSGQSGAGPGRATATASKRRWRWQAGQVTALRRIRSPQCGQFHASPDPAARVTIGVPPTAQAGRGAKGGSGRASADAEPGVRRRRRVDLAFLPAELDLAAHLRASGHRQAAGLQVADQRAGFLQLNATLRDDVPAHLAADVHGVGLDLALDGGAGLDRQLTLHVDVPLEAPGDPDVPVAFDLALDREAGGQDGLGELARGVDRHRLVLHWAGRFDGAHERGTQRNHRRPLDPRLGFGRRLLLAGLTEQRHCHSPPSRRTARPPALTTGSKCKRLSHGPDSPGEALQLDPRPYRERRIRAPPPAPAPADE